MDDDGGVFARFDHFVEVADCAVAHGACQRAIDPDGFAAGDEVTADEVGGGEVIVTGDGY